MAARVNEWGVTKEEEQAKLASLSERAHEAGFLGKGYGGLHVADAFVLRNHLLRLMLIFCDDSC